MLILPSNAGGQVLRRDHQQRDPLSAGRRAGPAVHICVAGAASRETKLLEALCGCGRLTLVRDIELLWPGALEASVAALALDMGRDVNGGLALLSLLAEERPDLAIVIINGRLSQSEIAEAFRRGACDYFSASSCRDLVVERLISLSRLRAGRTEELR